MQSTSLIDHVDSLSDEERVGLLTDTSLRSLLDVLTAIPDPRSRHGKRYDLPMLLTCLAAAMICGCNSLDAVGSWCREHRRLLRRLFGPRRHLSPTGSLYRGLLPRLDAAQVEWALAGWMLTTRPRNDAEPLALDGTMLYGACAGDDAAPRLLSVVTHQTGETLAQVPIGAKRSEIPYAHALLPWLYLTGRVVTADAFHTLPSFAQAILEGGADYLLWVKGNQNALHADLVTFFTDPDACCTTAHTVERHRGRIERRMVRASTGLNDYIIRFPAVAQVVQVTREVTERTGTHTDVDDFITSCAPHVADPDRLLALIRGHWSIERQHYLRDVVFGEDHCHVRTGDAPQILAALRNALLTLLRRDRRTAITAARRHFASHPSQAIALVHRSFPAYR